MGKVNSSIKLTGLEKSFGSNRVLRGIDLDIPAGEVTILMGANGAGKSTLVKVMCGVHKADSGTIYLAGEEFNPQTPAEAIKAGIVTVHQNINDGVVPDLDVASNLMLDVLANPHSSVFLLPSKIRKSAKQAAERLGLDLDMRAPVHSLSLADKQLVAITRAMAHEPNLLILDEPTSSLSLSETQRLFELLDRLKARGVAILYISHRMSDIKRMADRIVSMRDGEVSGVFEGDDLDYIGAVNAMLGRKIADVDIQIPEVGAPVLELENIQLLPSSKPFSLAAHKNEIIVITGLVGVGKSLLASVLFGREALFKGEISLNGQKYNPKNITDAINEGVFLCAKDRGTNGIIPEFNISHNISLPFLSTLSKFGFIGRGAERGFAKTAIKDLGIICQGEDDNIEELSGGNQQKVMVARWLMKSSKLLILDEPFQGVDIAARRDIGNKLRETAKDRATIVFVTELDEALEIADRIFVMSEHGVVGEHRNMNADADLILAQVLGDQVMDKRMNKNIGISEGAAL
ncbi:MAG: sugar ABC transporter ATP-binding protein [Alphaproteobacteria bacterium]|nr:sugar ABC transporter ATP-binding protein [Alphaproteobacteria bacterium]